MSNRNLQSHMRNDRIKWVMTGIMFFLIIIMFVGMCLQVFGQGKVKPSEWFTKQEEVQDPDSGLVGPGETEANGMKLTAAIIGREQYGLYTVAAGAESALTLIVTPTPADADLTGGKFTYAFKNAGSEWATGKTLSEYVTLSQSNEKQAVISCLKAFGEPIVVTYTVSGEKGESKTATYQLDYRARINTDMLYFKDIHYYLGYSPALEFGSLESNPYIYADLTFCDYTVKDTFSVVSAEISLGEFFVSQFSAKGITPLKTKIDGGSQATVSDKLVEWRLSSGIVSQFFNANDYKTAAFREIIESTSGNDCQFEVKIVVSDGHTTRTLDQFFDLDVDTLPKAAQSVQFSDGSQHTF